jgi:hypothetical protein
MRSMVVGAIGERRSKAAPSPALRAVPLPRYAGEDKFFSRPLLLPLAPPC